MHSLASIRPGETAKNAIYVVFSTSIFFFVIQLISAVSGFDFDLEAYGFLIVLLAPIMASILYYSKLDENWVQNKLENDLLQGLADVERFMIRMSFLMRTWETSIAIDPKPDATVRGNINSTIRGSDIRDELWYHRIGIYMRLIIACLFLSSALIISREMLLTPNYGIVMVAGSLLIAALTRKLLRVQRQFEISKYATNLISGLGCACGIVLVGVLSPLVINGQMRCLIISLPLVLAIDYTFQLWMSGPWDDTVSRAFAVTKLRLLNRFLTYSPILVIQEEQSASHEDHQEIQFRESVAKEIDSIEQCIQRRDWGIALGRIERLVGVVDYFAYETIDGHRINRGGILEELKVSWKQMLIGEDSLAWPKLIWVRHLSKRLIDLNMQPKGREVISSIMRLEPQEFTKRSNFCALFKEELRIDDVIPIQDADSIQGAKNFLDGELFRNRDMLSWEDFLDKYVRRVKGWRYFYQSDVLTKAALQSLRHQDMEEALKGAIRRNPDDAESYLDLGFSFLNQGEYKEAHEMLDIATRLLTNKSVEAIMALLGLGIADKELGNLDKAEITFKSILAIPEGEPLFPWVRTLLSELYEVTDRVNDAEHQLRYVIEQDPNNPDSHLELAEFLSRRGRRKETEQLYKHLIKGFPNKLEPLLSYAKWLIDNERLGEAEKICEEIGTKEITSYHDWTEFASVLESCSQYDAAEAAAREALKIDEYNELAWIKLGDILVNLDRIDQAVGAFRRALEIGFSTDLAHYGLAKIYEKEGNLVLAEDQLNEALKKKPRFAAALVKLADLEKEAGKFEEAIGKYNTAVEEMLKSKTSSNLESVIVTLEKIMEIQQLQGNAELMKETQLRIEEMRREHLA